MDSDEIGTGLDLQLGASLELAAGKIETAIQRFVRLEQQRLARLPNYVVAAGRLVQPTAAAQAAWDFGTPQPGRRWEIRLWFIDSQPDGSNTSNFLLLVGANLIGAPTGNNFTNFTAAQVDTSLGRWRFNQAPNNKEFGGSQITVKSGEHVQVIALGTPVNTSVSVVIAFDDMPDYSAAGAVAVE